VSEDVLDRLREEACEYEGWDGVSVCEKNIIKTKKEEKGG
jgi:hypothetical protein